MVWRNVLWYNFLTRHLLMVVICRSLYYEGLCHLLTSQFFCPSLACETDILTRVSQYCQISIRTSSSFILYFSTLITYFFKFWTQLFDMSFVNGCYLPTIVLLRVVFANKSISFIHHYLLRQISSREYHNIINFLFNFCAILFSIFLH